MPVKVLHRRASTGRACSAPRGINGFAAEEQRAGKAKRPKGDEEKSESDAATREREREREREKERKREKERERYVTEADREAEKRE